jgi:hypothetical protein
MNRLTVAILCCFLVACQTDKPKPITAKQAAQYNVDRFQYSGSIKAQNRFVFSEPVLLTSKHTTNMNEATDSLTRAIKLTQGKFAIVDAADFEWLNQWRWYFQSADKTRNVEGYAARSSGKNSAGKRCAITMQSQIMGVTIKSLVVDHADGNGLNNIRRNLRMASRSQNAANRPINKNNSVGLKGVFFCNRTKKYCATITVFYKRKFLGYFDHPEEAGGMVITASIEYFGEFHNS